MDLSLPALQRGAFKSEQLPGVPRTVATRHDLDGRATELRRSVTVGATTTTESWKYDYLTSGANAGKLSTVTLRRTTDSDPDDPGATWDTVRSVAYDYYLDYATTAAAADAFGNLGDLRSATIKDGSGTALVQWL